MKVLRLGRFRSMEVDHPPFLVPTDVGLGESPVIGDVLAIQCALALQSSRDHGGISIDSDMEVGSAVAQELHASGMCESRRVRLRHHRHSRYGDLEVVGPDLFQGGSVALFVR